MKLIKYANAYLTEDGNVVLPGMYDSRIDADELVETPINYRERIACIRVEVSIEEDKFDQ